MLCDTASKVEYSVKNRLHAYVHEILNIILIPFTFTRVHL